MSVFPLALALLMMVSTVTCLKCYVGQCASDGKGCLELGRHPAGACDQCTKTEGEGADVVFKACIPKGTSCPKNLNCCSDQDLCNTAAGPSAISLLAIATSAIIALWNVV